MGSHVFGIWGKEGKDLIMGRFAVKNWLISSSISLTNVSLHFKQMHKREVTNLGP